MREGTPIGVIILMAQAGASLHRKQIELVTTFADQAVIAIENVRLFDEVRQRTRELSEALEQQTATSEVLRVITSSPGELEPVFDRLSWRTQRASAAPTSATCSSTREALPTLRSTTRRQLTAELAGGGDGSTAEPAGACASHCPNQAGGSHLPT